MLNETLKVSVAWFVGVFIGIIAVDSIKNTPQTAPQITMECPPGLAEQAAAKDAVQVKAQADFEALKKGTE